MQALRAARNAACMTPRFLYFVQRRCLETATVNHLGSAAATASTSSSVLGASSGGGARAASPVPLSNIEAHWERMSSEDKLTVHEQLESLQVKDWKELSLQERKAAYYVAFGPHGPRAPTGQPGDNFKIFLGTVALIAIGGAVFFAITANNPVPRTMTKEWQQASNERAKEMNLNPISGISSEDYKGKGFVEK